MLEMKFGWISLIIRSDLPIFINKLTGFQPWPLLHGLIDIHLAKLGLTYYFITGVKLQSTLKV